MMNLKKSILAFTLLFGAYSLCCNYSFAQKIELSFPHFAGKEYAFWLFKADRQDTISVGKLDERGRATLVIPPSHKGYRGMSQWLLKDGGGLSLVIYNENFSVGSEDAQPSEKSIIFNDSPENIFLISQAEKQTAVLQKLELMTYGLSMYDKSDPIYPTFEQEMAKQSSIFEAIQTETAQSPLYAARFRSITDFLGGVGRKIFANEEEKAEALSNFFANDLDFEALYTSNHWSNVFNGWMDMNSAIIKDDAKLLDQTRKALARIHSDEVYTAFAEKVATLYSKFGKDKLIEDLSSDLARSGKLSGAGSFLQWLTKAAKGTQAPAIVGLKNPSFAKRNTLLVFYQSGCGNCTTAMEELIRDYDKFQKGNVRIVSISADSDQGVFTFNSTTHPWEDKLCDYQGIGGKNFQNYGVMGTPTFILVDSKGTVVGRYATVTDVANKLGL